MNELDKKKKEEYVFEIEMAEDIRLRENLYVHSLMNPCPRCGCRMDTLNKSCNYCGYIEFETYSNIVA